MKSASSISRGSWIGVPEGVEMVASHRKSPQSSRLSFLQQRVIGPEQYLYAAVYENLRIEAKVSQLHASASTTEAPQSVFDVKVVGGAVSDAEASVFGN